MALASDFVVLCLVFAASATLTGAMRRYAVLRGLVDKPNARSSHTVPTPRGGGLAIVVTVIGVIAWLNGSHQLSPTIFNAVFAGGAIVAIAGFVDDHKDVSPLWRIIAHIAAAVTAVACLSPSIGLGAGFLELRNEVLVGAVWVVLVVWFINLFNFMDGTDGLAGAESIFVLLGATVIVFAEPRGVNGQVWQIGRLQLTIVAACLGFLIWNWPPAKIFMGDVGSGFLGFVLGAVAMASVKFEVLPIWTWLILVGVFFVDATYTLLRRMVSGARWYEAHRSHAYQRLARRFGSHAKVLTVVSGVNLLWLLPLAWASVRWLESGWWITCLAYAPLVMTCMIVGAGESADASSHQSTGGDLL